MSAYEANETYKIIGRASKRRLAYLFNSSPPPRYGLAGVVILRMTLFGDIRGWWLGVGREGGDIGGEVTWIRAEKDQNFKVQVYPVQKEAWESIRLIYIVLNSSFLSSPISVLKLS